MRQQSWLIALVAPLLASTAMADVWHVRASLTTGAESGTSWSDAFRGRLGLQRALDVAQPGDSIWVAAGVYAPAAAGGPRSATFALRSGVQVLGGFAGSETSPLQRNPALNLTALTGDLNGNGNDGFPVDNSLHVVTAANVDGSGVFDGFTVRDGISGEVGADVGACLLVMGGSPVFRDCTFADGNASRGGGAGVIGASPTFEGCTFTRSVARFGANFFQGAHSGSTLRRCRFLGQSLVTGGTAGVGIYSGFLSGGVDDSVLAVDDCDFSILERPFSCPAGLAIHVHEGAASITRSRFINNRGCGDGAVHADAPTLIDRCTFIGNEGRFDGGAALFAFDGQLTVTNSLFAGNDREGFSTFSVGGSLSMSNCTIVANGNSTAFHSLFILFDGPHTIRNCVIWDNRTGGAANPVFSGNAQAVGLRFDRSLVQGWTGQFPGLDSFSANPAFVSALGPDGVAGTLDDDLRLAPTSPAIDRGDNSFLPAGLATDLSGSPRFRDDPAVVDLGIGPGPIIDLGALERQPPCLADFNRDGLADSNDFFGFLVAFFGQAPEADVDTNGVVNSADFFAFVSLFFSGCPG